MPADAAQRRIDEALREGRHHSEQLPREQRRKRPRPSDVVRAPRGCSWGGSPQSRGSGAQPQVARRRRRFFGAFLTDFHEVLLLFCDQLKPKNGYKYSHSSC